MRYRRPTRPASRLKDGQTSALVAVVAAERMNVHPDFLVWHYLRAAIQHHGDISKAARALHMHRRTIQRIMGKNCPPALPELPGK